MFIQSLVVEGAATGVPTSAFRGCSAYVRQPAKGDDGFYIVRVSGVAPHDVPPDVKIHMFVGDEMDVALALDRLRTRGPSSSGQPSPASGR